MDLKLSIVIKSTTIFLVNTVLPAPMIVSFVNYNLRLFFNMENKKLNN